jgi:hypothetical protein
MSGIYVNGGLDNMLEETARANDVGKEALSNILLVLSLKEQKQVERAVALIKTWKDTAQ